MYLHIYSEKIVYILTPQIFKAV